MRLLIPILLLLASCAEAMACPGCNYERFLTWYPQVVCLRLGVASLLAVNRLDFVRVLGVFVGYEILWYYGHIYAGWYAHPLGGVTLIRAAATVVYLLLEVGAPGAALLWLVGRSRFFRRTPEKGLPWWQAALYVPAAIAIRLFV